MSGNINGFNNTFNYKVIYIFKIYDDLHKGILKVGESTLKTNNNIDVLTDNCDELNKSARNRIKQYTNTIGVQEELLYTTLAIDKKGRVFKDKDVHRVLKNSGIKKHEFNNKKNPEEWFETDVQTVINAVNAVKAGRKTLLRTEVNEEHEDIEFRPEQIEAIECTIKRFETGDRMLWNAKMRFGKTLSTLEVIKRMSKSEKFNLSKAIILTHRPVVDEGWFDDFKKIFYNDDTFLYGSKRRTSIDALKKSKKKFIYFASMQDLRESNRIGGIYLKNDDVFEIDWDLIVIDEAHEGTQTELGKKVLEELLKSDTDHNAKQLHLSGTPFNLISDFSSNEIYTWDYIMEQKAKLEWEISNPLVPNPYDDLPKLNILTYNLEEFMPNYIEVADKAFNFREFFRVWTGETEKDGEELNDPSKIGKFKHEEDVKKFLALLAHESNNNYPFSKKEYRDNFRHSFWILPGVKEAKALKDLMMQDEVFSMFDIVNVAGSGDNNGDEALDAVHNAIGNNPEDTYTITLSCGKLTTGVTVREWSAVLYLAGSFSTSASSYLQTIFRVQSPASFGGKQKTDCYVFDFAPDRTLKMVAQAGDLSTRAGSVGSKETMKMFLNYCPVIAVNGSEMKPYNVTTMLQQLKQAYVERVVDNGFDDVKIYNDNLLKLDDLDLAKFAKLKGIIGTTNQKVKINEIEINKQGFTDEEWTEIEKAKSKPKAELTEEQKKLLEEMREKNKQKKDAISILRGISIRIPLLIYGASIGDDEEITIDNFTEIVDDKSWEEFMPTGVTKRTFKDFSKYYDNEIFIGAGRRIRDIAKHADTLNPIERAKSIANIFSTFRNPDKETVLTPWRTVNMHLGDTLGGYNFYDEKYIISIEEPRLINNGNVTKDILFNEESKILELNSKTGLYPLYITVSLYRQRCSDIDPQKLTEELERALWDETIKNNIFIVCKTKMAKTITKRTLTGYRDISPNIIYDENIIDTLSNNFKNFKSKVLNPKTWNVEVNGKMKFNAIVGNPPYQVKNSIIKDQQNASAVYNYFVDAAKKLSPDYISMIMPSRWMTGGRGLDNFRKDMLKDDNIIVLHDYLNARECFSNVEIKGGICYFLLSPKYKGKCNYYLHKENKIYKNERNLDELKLGFVIRDLNSMSIIKKVIYSKGFEPFSKIAGSQTPFGIVTSFTDYKEKPDKKYSMKIYGNKFVGYTKPEYITKNQELANRYKVLVPKAVGNGVLGSDVIKPILPTVPSICTQTYIVYGDYDNQNEAKNLLLYMKTKFFHFMLGQLKNTQQMAPNLFNLVPIQDYTDESDINWKKSLSEIDNQLYSKYKLSDEEIKYIEELINCYEDEKRTIED